MSERDQDKSEAQLRVDIVARDTRRRLLQQVTLVSKELGEAPAQAIAEYAAGALRRIADEIEGV